jgi:LPXTG-site transpeptidase (sortase) family protein
MSGAKKDSDWQAGRHQPKTRTASKFFLIFGTGLVLLAIGWQANSFLSTFGTGQLLNYDAIVYSDSPDPEEKKPNTSNYNVPADHPRSIYSRELGVDGFIQQVAINKSGNVAAPSNINLAGWYVNSNLPGLEGLSIIDGHVNGKHKGGIFKQLSKAKVGMRFDIEYGDRTTKTFEVVAKKQVSERQSSSILFAKDGAIDSQLNLITCGGDFDRQTNAYVDRIIVIAKLVN